MYYTYDSTIDWCASSRTANNLTAKFKPNWPEKYFPFNLMLHIWLQTFFNVFGSIGILWLTKDLWNSTASILFRFSELSLFLIFGKRRKHPFPERL